VVFGETKDCDHIVGERMGGGSWDSNSPCFTIETKSLENSDSCTVQYMHSTSCMVHARYTHGTHSWVPTFAIRVPVHSWYSTLTRYTHSTLKVHSR
jgi:hypothetical protein